jgi:hypothetical protein
MFYYVVSQQTEIMKEDGKYTDLYIRQSCPLCLTN